jgi:hypothetical protein
MEHPGQHEDAPPAANRAVKLPPSWTANPAILCVRTDSTPPRRVKLPCGIQRYPPRPIIPHDGGDLFFSPQRRSSHRRSSQRHRSQRRRMPSPEQPAPEQPADQWHSLRSCVCEPEPGGGMRFRYHRPTNPKLNPNPSVACAFAPPVCKPEAEPEPGGGVRFRTTGLRTRSRTRTRQWRALPHRRSANRSRTRTRRWRALPHRGSANRS